jgi:hypothetical protein
VLHWDARLGGAEPQSSRYTRSRIEDGSYGYCEETGEPISLKRLEARPIATLSLDRAGFQALERDRLAGLLAVTVGPVLDARERGIDRDD